MVVILQDIATMMMSLGIDIVGASALIGTWIAILASESKDHSTGWGKLMVSIFVPLLSGLAISFTGWILALACSPTLSLAQEGLALKISLFSVFSLACVSLLSGVTVLLAKQIDPKSYQTVYSIILLSAIGIQLIPVAVFQNQPGVSFALRDISQMLMMGTLFVLVFLYLKSRTDRKMAKALYPFFNRVTKIFWVGVFINFISIFPVFGQLEFFSDQFRFEQFAFGVAIVSFALLSGPIRGYIERSLYAGGKQVSSLQSLGILLLSGIAAAAFLMMLLVDSLEFTKMTFLTMMELFLALSIIISSVVICIERCFQRLGYKV